MSVILEDMEDIYKRGYEWNKLNNASVLITGGYGMLASYIVFFLIYLNEKHDYNIKILCHGKSREKMRLRYGEYFDKAYFIPCFFSLLEPILLDNKVDYIFHTASIANPSYYAINPVEVEEPNAIGTYFLLQYARMCNVKGFLFFSTGDIYGTVPPGTNIAEHTYGWSDPLDAHSCYGESKRMGETLCASFQREYKVPTRIARIAHTYGPTMDLDGDPRVFASFVKNVINSEDIVMLSDGSAMRAFCYLADATAAFMLIILKGADGEAYNVCNTKQFVSIWELANIVSELRSEQGIKVYRKERDESDSYMEAIFNRGNKLINNKLMELGWDCEYDIKVGFDRVISYFEKQTQAKK